MAASARNILLGIACMLALCLACIAPGYAFAGESEDASGNPDATLSDSGAKSDNGAQGGQAAGSDEGASNGAGNDGADEGGSDDGNDEGASGDGNTSGSDDGSAGGNADASGSDDGSAGGDADASGSDDGSAGGDADASGSDSSDSEGGETVGEAGDEDGDPEPAEGDANPDPTTGDVDETVEQTGDAVVDTTDESAEAIAATTTAVKAEKASKTAKTTTVKATTATGNAKKASSASTAAKGVKKVIAGAKRLLDGTYVMNLDKNTSMMADIEGSSSAAGAKMMMKKDANKTSQRWVFTWVEKFGAYTIKNVKSGLYVTTAKAAAGKELVSQRKLGKLSASSKQLWVVQKTGTGYKILANANQKVGLGTWSGKTKDGYYLTMQSDSDNKFKFYLLAVDDDLKKPAGSNPAGLDGTFVKVKLAKKGSLALDTDLQSGEAGAKAKASKSDASQTQKWRLDCVNEEQGLYTIVNVGTGKALQVAGNSRHIGTEVKQQNKTGKQNQQWWVRKNSNGTYTFTSRFNGLKLTSDELKRGSDMLLKYKPAADNSTYKVAKVKAVPDGIYEVLVNGDTKKTLSMTGNATKKGAQLGASAYDSQFFQKLILAKGDDGTYTVKALNSGKTLADVNGKILQGTKQTWNLVWMGAGFALQSATTGNYLTLNSSNKAVGSSSFDKEKAQLTFISRHTIDDGAYYIQYGKEPNKVLGVYGKKAADPGTKLYVYDKADNLNLKFKISYLGKDSKGEEVYKILNAESNMAIQPSGSSIIQKDWKNTQEQKWKANMASNGTVLFVNMQNGKAITNTKTKTSTGVYYASTTKKSLKNKKEQWQLKATDAFNKLQLKAYKKIKNASSNTRYAIAVDLKNHWLWVYERGSKSDPWSLKYEWRCSNGKKATPTPAVNRLTSGYKRYKNPQIKPDGQTEYQSSFYYMTYVDSGKYIHTPLYKKGSHSRYKDKRMGRSISNGCIRVKTPNAIWVYKHIKRGTRIITYYH